MSCPDCTTGGILPGEPTGTFSTKGAYYAAAPVATSKRAVLLLTDAFGLALKNCKILADNLASRLGCDVWVPDIFDGYPLAGVNQNLLPDRVGVKMSLFDWLKCIIGVIPNIPAYIKSRPSVVDGRVSSFIKVLQDEKKYEHIGVVGYCFGGSTAVRLGSTGLVRSIVVCHPAGFSIPQLQAIKVPAAWVCAEDDIYFSRAFRLKAEAAFAERKGKDNFIDYEFRDYKGTTHGFAARPNMSIPEVKEAHDKAFEQTVEWLDKTLPLAA